MAKERFRLNCDLLKREITVTVAFADDDWRCERQLDCSSQERDCIFCKKGGALHLADGPDRAQPVKDGLLEATRFGGVTGLVTHAPSVRHDVDLSDPVVEELAETLRSLGYHPDGTRIENEPADEG